MGYFLELGCTGQRPELILGLVACHLLRCSFCVSWWAGEMLVSEAWAPNFSVVCSVWSSVPAGSLEPSSGRCVLCLVVLVGLCLAILVIITAGWDTLVWRSVVMVSLPGREIQFLNELLLLFRYPPRSAAALLEGTLPLRYCAGRFASRVPLGAFLLQVTLRTWLLKRVWMLALFGCSCSYAWFSRLVMVVAGLVGGGGGVKRVRINLKTHAHLVRHVFFFG